MNYRSVKGFKAWPQMGVLLALLGIGIVLSGLLQSVVAAQAMGVPYDNAGGAVEAMLKPENRTYTRLLSFLNSFCMAGMPALFYLLVCHGSNPLWLGFSKHVNTAQLLTGYLVVLFVTLFAGTLKQWSMDLIEYVPVLKAKAQAAEKLYSDMMLTVTNLKSPGQYALAVVMVCLLPAIFEEAFFRGTVQNLFTRWWKRPVAAILASSLLFTLIHASYYLFLSRFVLSVALGWIFYRSKNIWVPIVAHFLNNLAALTVLYFNVQPGGPVDVNNLTAELPWWMGLGALVLAVALCLLFDRVSAKNQGAVTHAEDLLYEKAKPFYDYLNSEKSKWL
jgi:uncharacterized protein